MSWKFVLHPVASDQLQELPKDVDDSIRSKLEEMVTNEWLDLRDYDVEKLRGCDPDIYRTRIGGHRVFFLCEHPIAAILHVDKREGAYGNTDRLDIRGDDFYER